MNNQLLTSLFTLLIGTFSFLRVDAQCGQLIWSDEFNNNSLDQTKWNYDIGNGCPNLCGWGNGELQYYTDNTDNIRVTNGLLEIEARNDNGNYTSAKITTQGLHSWKYGRFEMRAKLAAGTGLWPAFWLLPVNGSWPMTGEIDIMENRGDQMGHIGGTLHYGNNYPNNLHDGTGYDLPSGSFSDDFHEFAIEWEEGEIRWYVDDILYKTETSNPNSLNPASNNNPWPWDDQEFYLIVNMAIGGENTWYTGRQPENFGNSATMLVDYVRVYDAPQPEVEIEGPERVFASDVNTYSTSNVSGQTYNWTLPEGAAIESGTATNEVFVNWEDAESGEIELAITHNSGACNGNTFVYTLPVEVYENSCDLNIENFEDRPAVSYGFRNGVFSTIENPSPNQVNSSFNVGEYTRNGSSQYDVFILEDALLRPGASYTSEEYIFQMDIMTDAPIGTSIDLQLGNLANAGDYPAGVHSTYSTITTVQNEWETLTFSYLQSPDPNGNNYSEELNRIIMLFNPNSYSSNTYRIDNFRMVSATSTNTLTINGSQVLDENEMNVEYDVNGGNPSSSYLWESPQGSTITDGQGSSGITVDFGMFGGIISVQESLSTGCWGEAFNLPVAVGDNACYIFNDDFNDADTQSWIEITGDADFSISESGSDWTISSNGHDQWAALEYTINDGLNPMSIDFTDTDNIPTVTIRAKASSPVILRATFIDNSNIEAANTYLLPLNTLYLTDQYQEYTIDFNGQFWDEFNGGGELDQTSINRIKLSLNPGWSSFPEQGYAAAFVGTVDIDYIKIGSECTITRIDKASLKENLAIYPNPFSQQFIVEGIDLQEVTTMNVFNSLGEVVEFSRNDRIIQLSDEAPSGVYFLQLGTTNATLTTKLTKQ